jgi:excisionase family DNA binding protein
MLAPSAPPTHLTLAEVAPLCRISAKTLEHWVRSGKLPGAFKIGHRGFFDRETVLDHLKQLRGGTAVAGSHEPIPPSRGA